MVIGMDFYKDSAQKNSSVCAFIASIDNKESKLNCTKYFSRCHIQPRGQEFSNSLEMFMIGFYNSNLKIIFSYYYFHSFCFVFPKDALAKYNEKNHTFPDRVIIYRDGVSDGQLDAVAEFEVPQIKKSFNYVSQEYK